MWLLLVPAREKSITPSFISEGRGAHDFIQPGERRIKKNSPLMWSSLIVMQEQEGKRHLNGGSCYPEHMGIVCQWVQRSHLCGDQWGLEGSRSMSNQMYRFTQVYLDTCWDCRDSCLKSTETILLSCSVKCLFHNKTDNPNHQTFYQIFWTLQYVFFFLGGGCLVGQPERYLSRRLPAEWTEQVAAAASAPGGSPSSARRYSGRTPRRSRTPARWFCTRKPHSCFSSSPSRCSPPRRRRSTPAPLRTSGPRASRCRRTLRPRRTRTPGSSCRRRGSVPPGSPLVALDTSTCHSEKDIRQCTGRWFAHQPARTQRRRLRTATKTWFKL